MIWKTSWLHFRASGLIFCGLHTMVIGEPPPPPAMAPSTAPVAVPAVTVERINALAADLASDSRADRAAAEQSLIALGPEALEWLPRPEASRDPQTRDSLLRIVRAIEAADAVTALESPTIFVPGSSSRRKWIEQLVARTGNRVRFDTLPAGWLDAETRPPRPEPMTFWEVIRWLEADQQVHAELGREMVLTWHEAPPTAPRPVAEFQRGPFRIQCLECQRRAHSRGGELVRVRLRLSCEPRLRPLFLVSAADSWKVRKESVDFPQFTPGATRELPGGAGPIEVSWDFLIPPEQVPPTEIDIEGKFALTLATRFATIDFRDLQGPFPVTRKRGQARVALLAVRSQAESTTLRLAIALGSRDGLFESYRAGLMIPDLSLESAGQQRVPDDLTQIQEDPDGIVVESRFSTPSIANAKLEAIVPTAISTQPVEFWFDDVPLLQASEK